jgi:hypothetical protein
MLLAVAGALPNVSEANRATQQIMKQIRIPPPYTPTYQPPLGQWYAPPTCFTPVTPNYSPQVIPDAFPLAPQFHPVAPPVPVTTIPVAVTNATSTTGTNVHAVDKAVKTPAPAVTPEKKKASKALNPVEKK